jgi:hypothetical protein
MAVRLSEEQIKLMADRAEARSRGDGGRAAEEAELVTAADDDDAEWERGFGETCDKAGRERSREIIEAEIARLARLTAVEYEVERKASAKRLDMRPSVLDALVKARRPKNDNDDFAQPHWKVELSTEPVAADDLLKRIADQLKLHVVFSDEAANAVALWLAFAWTHDAATHSPILLVTSAERDSGKTTLLGLVNFLSPRGLMVIDPSAAVLFRMIEKWAPTMVVDEADDQFKENPPLRSVINSGWTRGAGVPRCNPDTNEPEIFSTFGPKAIGMKGKAIPDTILSRSIVIEMVRKKPGERVADFEHLDDAKLKKLRQRLARWAADNRQALIAARPAMPDGFQNRLAANWRPLLAIAEHAGGAWPALAKAAAIALAPKDAGSIGTTLLGDIRAMAADKGVDRLTSSELAETLYTLEDRPWAEWGRNAKPISKNQIARILKDFKIYPETIRIGERTAKGYHLHQFAEVFARYLDQQGGNEPSQRNNADAMGTSELFQTVTEKTDVTDGKCEKPAPNGQCYGVTVQIPPLGPNSDIDASYPRVCQHCGEPATADAPVLLCAINGEEMLLHKQCQEEVKACL